MMDTTTRMSDGTFAKSSVNNPTGANGRTGWQPYEKRAKYWMDKLSVEELIALAQDPKEFGKLSSYDAIIVRHLVGCILGSDVRLERKDLIDRIEGTPKQTIENTGNLDMVHYMAHDQKIIDRYNAKRLETIDQKPAED